MAPETLDSDNPDPGRLRQLEERVKKARGQRETGQDAAPPSNFGVAFRMVSELVAAVIVGMGIGWGLDYLLHTSPLLLIVMFFVGFAAGFRNVIRTAREMDRKRQAGESGGQ